MNLYVFTDVLCDYTPGMCVIAAETYERAVEIGNAEWGDDHDSDDRFEDAPYAEYRLNEPDLVEGIQDYVYGGG